MAAVWSALEPTIPSRLLLLLLLPAAAAVAAFLLARRISKEFVKSGG